VVVLGRDVRGQKRMEEDLERQLAIESRVAQISRHFIALDSDRIDRGVRDHLETAAEFAGADRCRLIVLEPESRRPLGVYDWSAPGVALDMSEMDELGRGYLPWSSAALARGEVVQVGSPQRLPPAADAERRDLSARGVGSLLGVPVRSSESVIGFQVFESLSGSRTWSERDLTPLRLLGEIFVSAVKRKFAEASLRESEERFRAIAEQAGGLVLEVDLAGRIRYVSPGAERLLGRAPEALAGRTVREITHPDDFEALQRVVVDTMRRQSEIRFVLRMRHRDGSWRWFESAGRAYRSATGDLRLLSTVQDITERVAAERAVERQLAVEKRVAELSRRFLALSPDEIAGEIRGAMAETAELAGPTGAICAATGPAARPTPPSTSGAQRGRRPAPAGRGRGPSASWLQAGCSCSRRSTRSRRKRRPSVAISLAEGSGRCWRFPFAPESARSA
jgi:PAS domain S-box-containing protein